MLTPYERISLGIIKELADRNAPPEYLIVGTAIAKAAADMPFAHAIEWHSRAIHKDDIEPSASNFEAMQLASFIAKSEVTLIAAGVEV